MKETVGPFISLRNLILYSRIQEVCAAHAIYLLGAKYRWNKLETIFSANETNWPYSESYFLLIVIDSKEKKEVNEVQDSLERQQMGYPEIFPVILSLSTFSNWVQHKHPFIKKVLAESECIFGNNDIPLCPNIPKSSDLTAEKISLESNLERAWEFITAADLFLIRKQFPLCLFMLHQALEQVLTYSIHKYTCYRADTHNVNRLLKFTAWVIPSLRELYDPTSITDRLMFAILQKSYSAARYSSAYKVNQKEANRLSERVKGIYSMIISSRKSNAS